MDEERALALFDEIQETSQWHEYRLVHVALVRDYMLELNRRLGFGLDEDRIRLIGILHDVLKERHTKSDHYIDSHLIPWDLNDYVRRNMVILGEFGLEDYFNSDVQLHPLAGGIFLRKEFYIDDPQILYPIMFHSCPVMSIYTKLDQDTRNMIDLVMLSDKLSSNWCRLQTDPVTREKMKLKGPAMASVDLDLLVFGATGKELNYTLGLYVAKLMGNGKRMGPVGMETTLFYHKRLLAINPMAIDFKLGGKKEWPRRKNLSLMTR